MCRGEHLARRRRQQAAPRSPWPTAAAFPQDEPSSGMDPCSKRFLWRTVTQEVQDGCAVVLTSHR